MVNEHSEVSGDIRFGSFTDLLELVTKAISHSNVDNNQKLVSILFVNMPIWGQRETMWKMLREVDAPHGDHAANEMVAATEVFARELKYTIESGTEFAEPVHAYDDELGIDRCIGKHINFIDRKRLSLPTLMSDKVPVAFLNCVKD